MVLSVQNEKEKNWFNSIEERKKRDLNNYLMNIDIGLLAIYTKKERQETFEDYKCMWVDWNDFFQKIHHDFGYCFANK